MQRREKEGEGPGRGQCGPAFRRGPRHRRPRGEAGSGWLSCGTAAQATALGDVEKAGPVEEEEEGQSG